MTVVIFFVSLGNLIAQNDNTQLLSAFSPKMFRFSAISQQEISPKWDYYGNSTIGTQYDSIGAFELDFTHLASRSIYKNLGVTTGLSFEENDLFANLGLGYSKEMTNFNFSIYPALTYAIKNKELGTGLNVIAEYTPLIKGNLHLFTMLLVDFDYGFKGEIAGSQFLSIGIEPKKGFQTGFGLEFSQEDKFKDNSLEPSLFLGVSF